MSDEISNMSSNYYRLKKESLNECIRHCELKGNRDWWFLPDIQRSFVWQAKSSLLLLDSILRGWPFGSLTIQKASAQDCVAIAYRQFLKETGCVWEWSQTYGNKVALDRDFDAEPNEFYLVLDGQQRMQSLIFAFADELTGYKQNEWEWMRDLWGWTLRKVRNREYEICPLAGIYLDVGKLITEMSNAARIQDIKYFDSGVICYAIADKDFDTPYYYRDAENTFPVRKKSCEIVRFSRVWKFMREKLERIQDQDITVDYVMRMLQEYWLSPGWNLDQTILDFNGEYVARFIIYLYNNIYKMEVGTIELERPADVPEEVFQHDVVEIFTRLNHGGKQLTTAEITGAWLKNYWDYKKERKGADVVIEELKKVCLDKGLELPDFMRYASALWAIAGDNSNERKVIQNKDLTNAELLKKLAQWLSGNWKAIRDATSAVVKELAEYKWLVESFGTAAFPMAVLVGFRMRIEKMSRELNEQACAEYLHLTLDKIRKEQKRFWACSCWSDYWNIQTIVSLGKKFESIKPCDASLFVGTFTNLLEEVLAPKAENVFMNTEAQNRSQVRAYYSYLQVWHRLRQDRYDAWMSNLDSGDLHVDHCLAYAKWLELLGESRRDLSVEKDQEYRGLINSIGNCMLLRSSTNIGKGKTPFKEYFSYLWEKENEQARLSLEITDEMAMPDKGSLSKVRDDIYKRNLSIRKEIKDFIYGKLTTV